MTTCSSPMAASVRPAGAADADGRAARPPYLPRLLNSPVRVSTSEFTVSSIRGLPVLSGPVGTDVVVVLAGGRVVVVVVALTWLPRTVVDVVDLGGRVVAAEPLPGAGRELVGVLGGPDANVVGVRAMAASIDSSSGTRVTAWSMATRPHGAPSSWNLNTAAHRSANDPRVPSSVIEAPTR